MDNFVALIIFFVLIFGSLVALGLYLSDESFHYYGKEQIICRKFAPYGWKKSSETTCYKITPLVK